MITFHTRPWTMRDALLAQRLERNPQDIESLIALLVSRSDVTEQQIMALPLTALGPIIEQFTESMTVLGVVMALSGAWGTPESSDSEAQS